MARKSYTRKTSRGGKIQPAAMTLSFTYNIDPQSVSTNYIDLSQVASLVNRRFYRQGINWAVSGFKFLTNQNGSVQVQKLPNSWIMSNSWEKSFRTWTRMNNQALAESESVRPKFLDFKIYADSEHHSAGSAANLLPQSGIGAVATAGEWEPSKVVIPETSTTSGAVTEYELIAVGANNPGPGASGLNAKSLIEGYAASRGLPDVLDPNTPDDAATYTENWMTAIFNEGTLQDATVVGEMIDENNIAPYPFENDGVHTDTMYPGGANQLTGLQLHDIEYVTTSTIGGTTRLKGGNFPCGLIKVIHGNNSEAGDLVVLTIDLVPGNHRGYLCEPMTEM